jgi:hypothetical protein
MRTFARRTFAALFALAVAPAWSGCAGKKQTEYVAGISTQVRVPRDLTSVRVSVSIGGSIVFCRSYRAYNGVVQLPRSLGSYALNDPGQSGVLTYSIIGYSTEVPTDEEFDLAGCSDASVGDEKDTRIIRRSRQPYVPEKTLFLPMPLKYSCFDKTDCDGPDQTCKAGRCVSADTLPETLPEYTPDLLDGTGGACFSLTQCLGAAKPAVVVDAATCTYAVANTPSEPPLFEGAPDLLPGESLGEGLNVLITYDGGLNREVLDKDEIGQADGEGFTIPDPAKPQQFVLTPGLCDMVRGFDAQGNAVPHRITAIRASEVCRPKSKFQPICANDQLELMGDTEVGGGGGNVSLSCASRELTPPPSSLMVVVDNTTGHQTFFGNAETQAVNISFDDPAFARTTLGLVYAPGSLDCSASSLDVPPGPSRDVKTAIAASFGRAKDALLDSPPGFEGALARAYEAVGQAPDAFRRAVLVFGNRDFVPAQGDQCAAVPATTIEQAQAAKQGPNDVDTYVLLLAGRSGDDDTTKATALDQGTQLAKAGGTVEATDARSAADKANAQTLFQTLVQSLATCVYDVEKAAPAPAPGAPKTVFVPPPDEVDGVLSYIDPVRNEKHFIAAGQCAAEGAPGQGWGYGPDPKENLKRIYLCQQSCDEYRDVLKAAATFNLAYAKPAPAVPIFAHKRNCEPTPDAPATP